MENFLKKFKKDTQQISLTEDEREEMKHSVLDFARTYTAESEERAVVSPFTFSSFLHLHKALVAFLLLLVVGIPIVYASEESLPGEFFYPVKTVITEPLIEFTKIDEEERARHQLWLLERRMKEAALLTLEDKATPQALGILEEEIEESTEESLLILENVQEEEVVTARELHGELKSTLESYEEVLSTLAEEHNNTDVAELSVVIDEQEALVGMEFDESNELYIEISGVADQSIVEEHLEEIENRIETQIEKIDEGQKEHLEDLEDILLEAHKALEEGSYSDALESLLEGEQKVETIEKIETVKEEIFEEFSPSESEDEM